MNNNNLVLIRDDGRIYLPRNLEQVALITKQPDLIEKLQNVNSAQITPDHSYTFMRNAEAFKYFSVAHKHQTVHDALKAWRKTRQTPEYKQPFFQWGAIDRENRRFVDRKVRLRQRRYGKIKMKEHLGHNEYYFNSLHSMQDIHNAFRTAHARHNKVYKMNYQFGFTMYQYDVELQVQYVEFFEIYKNKFVLETPKTIKTHNDMARFIQSITVDTITENFRESRSATLWQLAGIYALHIVTDSLEQPIGNAITLPEYLMSSRNIITCIDNTNLCLFSCIACANLIAEGKKANPNTVPPSAKRLYKTYYGKKYTDDYAGFDMLDLRNMEEHPICLKYGLNVYSIQPDGKAIAIRLTEHIERRQIYLNLYESHFSYIKDISKCAGGFVCKECGTVIKQECHMKRHEQTCTVLHVNKFPKECKQYEKRPNKLKSLIEQYKLDLSFVPKYFALFDYEANLVPTDEGTEDTRLISAHIPLSVSIHSNIPNFETKHFSTRFQSVHDMNNALFEILIQISDIAFNLNKEYYKELLDKLTPYQYHEIINQLGDLTVLGFNSGHYDINLIKSYGLFNFGVEPTVHQKMKGCERVSSIPADSGYKVFKILTKVDPDPKSYNDKPLPDRYFTRHLKFLDIMNYCAGGTSYAKYIKMWECDLKKGFFPYEWANKHNLDSEQLAPYNAFKSRLRGCNVLEEEYNDYMRLIQGGFEEKQALKIMGLDKVPNTGKENYEYLQQVWSTQNMKTMWDFMKWYNNLDVIPGVEAVEKHMKYWLDEGLDMFNDAITLSGLSEKLMCNYAKRGLEKFMNRPYPKGEPYFVPNYEQIKRKIKGYIQQDIDAGRILDQNRLFVNGELVDETDKKVHEKSYISPANVLYAIHRQRGFCRYCRKPCTEKTWSMDRINNDKAHTKKNVLLACLDCNCRRGKTPFYKFLRQESMEAFHNEVMPQIYIIDEENQTVYYKMRDTITGGASIVFHRLHEGGITRIQRIEYSDGVWRKLAEGKLVVKIVGYDANALYPYVMGGVMPCGKLEYKVYEDLNLIDMVRDGSLFGFIECDIRVPEGLYNYFHEMQPIFKNIEIDPNNVEHIGEYMFNAMNRAGMKRQPQRKLIGSFFGEKILLYTPLLKWYLKHGLEVKKVYGYMKAIPGTPFKQYVEDGAQQRRDADSNPNLKSKGEMAKTSRNSSFGRTAMRKDRHCQVNYLTPESSINVVASKYFKKRNVIQPFTGGETVMEVETSKRNIYQNLPIQIAVAIYQMSKLRMLEFYYDCMDKYVSRDDFQLIEMDTDSNYYALTGDLEDIIKPEMREEWIKDRYNWFPNPDNYAYEKRTPGLFKKEYEGLSSVALTSKMYFVQGEKPADFKLSSKGTQKRTNRDILTYENYKRCLTNAEVIKSTNIGFRVINEEIRTYEQVKDGLSFYYDKKQVADDGITCFPCPL